MNPCPCPPAGPVDGLGAARTTGPLATNSPPGDVFRDECLGRHLKPASLTSAPVGSVHDIAPLRVASNDANTSMAWVGPESTSTSVQRGFRRGLTFLRLGVVVLHPDAPCLSGFPF